MCSPYFCVALTLFMEMQQQRKTLLQCITSKYDGFIYHPVLVI